MAKAKVNANLEPDGYFNGRPYWVNKKAEEDWFNSYGKISKANKKEAEEAAHLDSVALTMRRSCHYSPNGRHYMGF